MRFGNVKGSLLGLVQGIKKHTLGVFASGLY